MKQTLLLLALLFTAIAGAQIINIPDAEFKQRLLWANLSNDIARDSNGQNMIVDANSDGEIQISEALAVYHLDVEFGNLSSLTGINDFQNLRTIGCRYNDLSSLTLSLPELTYLNCPHNELSSLDVSGCPNLINLTCNDNQLVSLNVSGLPVLKWLTCYNNQLPNLNVTGLPALEFLSCSNNQLTALDVTTLLALKTLYCDYNQLSDVNLVPLTNLISFNYSGNTAMVSFDLSPFNYLGAIGCSDLGLTTLDLTGFTSLGSLICSNNPLTTIVSQDLTNLGYLECNNTLLTELDLSSSSILTYIHVNNNPLLNKINLNNGGMMEHPYECQFTNNPNLQLMCVDEGEAEIMLQYFEGNELSPPYMSTTCEFVPGEVYNSMSGVAKLDIDMNGCDNDPGLAYLKLLVSDGTGQTIKFTNEQGEYLKYVGAGSYTVTPQFNNSYYLPTPAQASATFTGMDGLVHQQDFCLTSNGVHPDIEIVIIPLGHANPGFDAYYKIVYRNRGNQVLSGSIDFNYNDAVLDYVLATPAEVSSAVGSLTWNYSNLMPFQSRYIVVKLNLNSPSEVPALNTDDVLVLAATATSSTGDDNPTDNSFQLDHLVGGSFDPNNIICLEGETEAPDAIGDYLHYVINFENTEQTPATFVVITNEIDTGKYDLNTLEIMDSSHSVETSVSGNVIEFRFDNINLGPDVYGNVIYKIKTKASLVAGDEVSNDAAIVFDYNFPVITNDATTIFAALSTEKFETYSSVEMYPNPTTGLINISSKETLRSSKLYDLQGRLLQDTPLYNTTDILDISAYPSGIYLLEIKTDAGMNVERIVKK